MAFDNSSNARRKRKLAAKIKQGCKQLKAAYRADRRKTEAAALAKRTEAKLFALPRTVPVLAPQTPALPVLNFTPEDITALREFSEQCREQQRKIVA